MSRRDLDLRENDSVGGITCIVKSVGTLKNNLELAEVLRMDENRIFKWLLNILET